MELYNNYHKKKNSTTLTYQTLFSERAPTYFPSTLEAALLLSRRAPERSRFSVAHLRHALALGAPETENYNDITQL